MTAPFQFTRSTKSASIAAGLMLGMLAGTLVAPAAADLAKPKLKHKAAASDEQKPPPGACCTAKTQCDQGKSISIGP